MSLSCETIPSLSISSTQLLRVRSGEGASSEREYERVYVSAYVREYVRVYVCVVVSGVCVHKIVVQSVAV